MSPLGVCSGQPSSQHPGSWPLFGQLHQRSTIHDQHALYCMHGKVFALLNKVSFIPHGSKQCSDAVCIGPNPTLTLVANSQNPHTSTAASRIKSWVPNSGRQFATSVNTCAISRQVTLQRSQLVSMTNRVAGSFDGFILVEPKTFSLSWYCQQG
jgi:hypothetical protein